MKEKQRTCITIRANGGANFSSFSEYINIPHNVDIIVCRDMSFDVVDADPEYEKNAFYVTSNLITNIHDQILGYGPNIGHFFLNSKKSFTSHTKIICS